ncbi:MAG: potassium-transporting ATPase subunit KdpC [Bacteroidales bacterium]|nr:potassium-transporting ATPase subunit KdpC [Bacteroidales bacterium]
MKTLLISLKIFLFFTVLTGIFYPLLITGIAQLAFPAKANGSMITENGKTVGSKLIGQQFDSAIYFTPRPSAVSYNPLPSGGSNFGLTNQKLIGLVTEREQQFIAFNQLDTLSEVPSEMLFASASGLDPHISPEAALLQVERIAKARKFNPDQKQRLVQEIKMLTEPAHFLYPGKQRINVLILNLYTDQLQ